MKRMLLNFGAYLAALAILLLVFTCMVEPEKFSVLLEMKKLDVAIILLISLGAYIGNGVEYYIMSGKMGFRMEKKDILLLPLAMNLAGTLLPVQGAMAYQIFYLRKKYGVSVSRGCSIAAFMYLITMTISGIAGVVISRESSSLCFFLISVLFAASAPILLGVFFLVRRIRFEGRIRKLADFVRSTLEGVVLLLRETKTVVLLVVVYFLRLICMIVMFAWIARSLSIEVGFTALLLLNLWNMLSLIIKFTPNNLGISQLVSGVMFMLIRLPEEQGVLISLTATMSFVLVALTLGVAAMGYHFYQISRN